MVGRGGVRFCFLIPGAGRVYPHVYGNCLFLSSLELLWGIAAPIPTASNQTAARSMIATHVLRHARSRPDASGNPNPPSGIARSWVVFGARSGRAWCAAQAEGRLPGAHERFASIARGEEC